MRFLFSSVEAHLHSRRAGLAILMESAFSRGGGQSIDPHNWIQISVQILEAASLSHRIQSSVQKIATALLRFGAEVEVAPFGWAVGLL